MKTCKLCSKLLDTDDLHGQNKDMDYLDIKIKSHVEIHQRQLRMITGQHLLPEEMMDICFGIEEQHIHQAGNIYPKMKGTHRIPNRPIPNVCYEIYEKQGRKRFLPCSVCGTLLQIVKGGHLYSSKMIKHASVHLDKDLYECRFCDHKCCTDAAIGLHLRGRHKLSGCKSNYIDHTRDYETDIIGMIRRCFGGQKTENVRIGKINAKENNGRRNIKGEISRVCHEIFKNNDRKAHITCAECGSSLKVEGKNIFLSNRMKAHAYMHLGKQIFECRFCVYKSMTPSSIRLHVLNKHQERSISQNYVDHTSVYQAEIIDMIRRCFGSGQTSGDQHEPDIKHALSRNRSKIRKANMSMKSPIPKRCYEIYEKHGFKKTLSCSVCGETLVVSTGGHFRNAPIITHAHRHLDKEMFECRFCEFKCPTRYKIDGHLTQKHALSNVDQNFINHSSMYEADVLDMIEHCFGTDRTSTEPTKTLKLFIPTTALSTYCRKLFLDKDRNAKVTCSECGKQMAVFSKSREGAIDMRIIYDHAFTHLDIRPYQCKLCNYHALSRQAIIHHLKASHERKYSDETCTNSSAHHEDELKDMVTRCFGNPQASSQEN